MIGAFIYVLWLSLAVARAAPGPPEEPPVTTPPIIEPADCTSLPLPPCAALGGSCMDLCDTCDGMEVINELFCEFTDTCKCCFPVTPVMPRQGCTIKTLICPSGMELIGGCCYSFSTEIKTWGDADEACKAMGDSSNTIRLAEAGTVEACDANKFMEAVVEHGSTVWLGACDTDAVPDGWQWKRTNHTLTTTGNDLWYHHEPMDGKGNCLEAARYNNPREDYDYARFKNEKCTESRHFVCQLF